MQEVILKIILNACKEKRYITEGELLFLCNELRDFYRVYDLVKSIDFSDDSEGIANYNYDNKAVSFNYKNMLGYVRCFLVLHRGLTEDDNFYKYANLTLIEMIIHEFEHVKHFKIIFGKNSFMKEYLLADYEYLLTEHDVSSKEILLLQNKYVRLSPIENLVKIDNMKEIILLISEDDFLIDLTAFYESELNYAYFRNYSKDASIIEDSPYFRFMKLVNPGVLDRLSFYHKSSMFNYIDSLRRFDFEERIRLGFYLSPLERSKNLK